MKAEVLLIVNRKARAGRADLQRGLELWRQGGWRIRELQPERPEQIPDLIRRHGREVDRIIIGSGDGTISRAAAALVESQRPFGVIPLGTANDFARTLHLPMEPVEACRLILAGHLQEIDLGLVNGHYFFNAANIGLGVKVAQHLSNEAKQRWGVLAYLRSFLKAFNANRAFRVRLSCDGRPEVFPAIQVAVGNGRHYGGGMTIAEAARIDDHLLNLFALKPQRLLELAAQAPALRQGKVYRQERVIHRAGRRLELRTSRVMQVYTDGELTTLTPARFEIAENALSVYVPADYQLRAAQT